MLLSSLFSPLELGPLTIPNRIVSSGHDTGLASNGLVTDSLIAYHASRAKGGAGLIVVQVAGVHESARYTNHLIMADNDDVIPGYKLLADTIHAYPTKVVGQLFHPGREIVDRSSGMVISSLAPSSVPNERFHQIPRALTDFEITQIIDGYVSAAIRLVTAGLDGVEVVASHGYLPSQFLNEHTNLRNDSWGGDEHRREAFLFEVLSKIRQALPDSAVGLRISIAEPGPEGLSQDQVYHVLSRASQESLIDYISLTYGTSATNSGSNHIAPDMGFPSAYLAPLLAPVRALTNLPLMLAGRINQPQDANRLIESGVCDATIMTRALICDPTMPSLAKQGAFEDIRACVGCNQACIGHFQLGVPISCIQYPESGRELLFPHPRKAYSPKQVVIVGAGPAGLKAAISAAQRGHQVDIYEASSKVGGQVRYAALLPGRAEFEGVTLNLLRALKRTSASLHLSTPLGIAELSSLSYDQLILATGASPYIPSIEQAGRPVVLNHAEFLDAPHLPPGRVVVIDSSSDLIAVGVALALSRANHPVTLVTSDPTPGYLLQQYLRDRALADLSRSRATTITSTRVVGIDSDSAYLQHTLTDEITVLPEVTAFVFCGWRRPNSDLATNLAASHLPFTLIGDASSPRSVEEAVYEGLTSATRL